MGITGQGQQGSNQQSCNPLGLGLNLGALPMNPAIVAAALNQAGWGLIGNLQNQPEPNFNQGALVMDLTIAMVSTKIFGNFGSILYVTD
ncbi:hypothetical protein NQ314_007097 [Rhamnusium bicolor]|uniref:Uncharacterized protein n=1 Tax=Rhamnusium bicolor TaxID=1586634 RepID=A0AAV8YUZ4_9CUCU|nr:hypothetical protein NQ314_007097 [Rhamnusium bicolor]